MAQRLRTLAEDPGSVSSAHMVTHSHVQLQLQIQEIQHPLLSNFSTW